MNPMLLVDGYKLDHRRQYPEGTQYVYSNWTARGSRVEGQNDVVLFGAQRFIQKYLVDDMNKYFFDVEKDTVLEQYQTLLDRYFGPNNIGVDHIADLWDLGFVPLRIKALPEGTLVPLRVPMLTIENTHPDFFWLTNYFETLLSAELWMPCTSATTAYRFRQMFDKYAKLSGGSPEFVSWQGHDFSMRGMAGAEAARVSAMGHLLSFTGTDTLSALTEIDRYYSVGDSTVVLGGSVPATEHSVMCAGGQEDELKTIERLLDLYPTGILSVVSDTWDFWRVLTVILPALKDKIMKREGKLVIRPDSGDPVKIICGDRNKSVGSPAYLGATEILFREFGGVKNKAGYIELDPHVGLIYGDGINEDRASRICKGLMNEGFASTNIVFGLGSYTYQYVTRDTYGFAMKATWAQVGGVGRDLFKDPVTDDGLKRSAKGRLAVQYNQEGELTLIENANKSEEGYSQLRPIFDECDCNFESFSAIRNRLMNQLKEN